MLQSVNDVNLAKFLDFDVGKPLAFRLGWSAVESFGPFGGLKMWSCIGCCFDASFLLVIKSCGLRKIVFSWHDRVVRGWKIYGYTDSGTLVLRCHSTMASQRISSPVCQRLRLQELLESKAWPWDRQAIAWRAPFFGRCTRSRKAEAAEGVATARLLLDGAMPRQELFRQETDTMNDAAFRREKGRRGKILVTHLSWAMKQITETRKEVKYLRLTKVGKLTQNLDVTYCQARNSWSVLPFVFEFFCL